MRIQDPGWRQFGSGMEKSWIRDPGSATLFFFVSSILITILPVSLYFFLPSSHTHSSVSLITLSSFLLVAINFFCFADPWRFGSGSGLSDPYLWFPLGSVSLTNGSGFTNLHSIFCTGCVRISTWLSLEYPEQRRKNSRRSWPRRRMPRRRKRCREWTVSAANLACGTSLSWNDT